MRKMNHGEGAVGKPLQMIEHLHHLLFQGKILPSQFWPRAILAPPSLMSWIIFGAGCNTGSPPWIRTSILPKFVRCISSSSRCRAAESDDFVEITFSSKNGYFSSYSPER